MTKTQQRVTMRVLFYILLVVIAFYLVFPFYWSLRSSITPDNKLFSTPVEYFPSSPTLGNYQLVLTNGNFLRALANSTLVAVTVTVLSLVIGVIGAYALGRFRFPGRLPVMYLILSMTMFPQIAVLGALFERISQFGLYNQLPALIITYLIFTLPFTVWVLTSFFQQMPKDLEEAAYVDGCTPMQTLYIIML